MSSIRADTDTTGVERSRVVAVLASWPDGETMLGSGFLIQGRLVLTAAHCIRNKKTGRMASRIEVFRVTDGATVVGGLVTTCPEQDVATIVLGDDTPWESKLPPVIFARANRSHGGILENCEGIGFPLFQHDHRGPASSEVHGDIYQTDGAETGQLLMYETRINPGLAPVRNIPVLNNPGQDPPSPWGGYSGTLLFHQGMALGVVVEHHPAQGNSALRAVAFDAIAECAITDPDARRIAKLLGLPEAEELPWAISDPAEPLAGLVERLEGNELPMVQDVNPYQAGATTSNYGARYPLEDTPDNEAIGNAGKVDPYVPRTYRNVDTLLRQALVPGRMVVLVGPSKSGKTRTAFEAVKVCWPQARLLIPARGALAALARHPRLRTGNDPVVVWLNDLQRYLTGVTDPLTLALLTSILSRPGPTVVVATIRTEERARLFRSKDELTREARRVLEETTGIELGSTSENPFEQAAARALYPGEDLSTYGLAEQLAGAPYLLQQYRDAKYGEPLMHAVIQAAIDWDRVGMPDAISENDLATLAVKALRTFRLDLRVTQEEVQENIKAARTPPGDSGQIAALETEWLSGDSPSYRAFSYLVAADDGQTGDPRPIPAHCWDEALCRANSKSAFSVSAAAYERGVEAVSIRASRQVAESGHTGAMFNLGILLANQLDPPDLIQARDWYEQAADAGHTGAMANLGNLLSDQWDPPDLKQARAWYEQAADAGHTGAMVNLGNLLSDQWDPPDLKQARAWYEQAANTGHTDAMVNLGILLVNQLDPPKLKLARTWYERAANAGHTGAMVNLGILLAKVMDPPDAHGARTAWQGLVNAGAGKIDSEILIGAAVNGAALDALTGKMVRAGELLDLAVQHGAASAPIYKETLSLDPDIRAAALHRLGAFTSDSDALNFIGIAKYLDGELDQAWLCWARSAGLGDTAAPLLLHVSKNPNTM